MFLLVSDQQYKEDIKFAAAVIGGAAAIYTAYHAWATLRSNIKRDKQRRSFEIIDSFNELDRTRIRLFLQKNINASIKSPEEIYKLLKEEKELEEGVVHLLGVLEDVSIAIQTDAADEEILFLSLRGIVIKTTKEFRGYIDYQRKNEDNNFYYIELEKLYDKWKENKSLVTGKSFRP